MIHVYDIDWDTDGEYIEDLPTELHFELELDEDFEWDEQVLDYLSDTYGWCICGCNIDFSDYKA